MEKQLFKGKCQVDVTVISYSVIFYSERFFEKLVSLNTKAFITELPILNNTDYIYYHSQVKFCDITFLSLHLLYLVDLQKG